MTRSEERSVVDELEALKTDPDSLINYHNLCKTSGLDSTCLRPFLYMHFLGFLSDDTDSWVDEITIHRTLWDNIVQCHETNVDRVQNQKDAGALLDAARVQVAAVEASETLIDKDMRRSFVDQPYFKRPKFLADVRKILALHSVYGVYEITQDNRDWAYRQGYHMLASIVYYLVEDARLSARGALLETTENGELVNNTIHRKQNEYKMSSDFHFVNEMIGDDDNTIRDTFIIFRRLTRLLDSFYNPDSVAATLNLDEICSELLKILADVDGDLHSLMVSPDGYQPSIFLNNWFRLMLAYQTSVRGTMTIWDRIIGFAKDDLNNPLTMLQSIVATILLKNRDKIKTVDSSELIQFLTQIPSLSDAEALSVAEDAGRLHRRRVANHFAPTPTRGTPRARRKATRTALPSPAPMVSCARCHGASDVLGRLLPLLYEMDGEREKADECMDIVRQVRDMLDGLAR